MSVINVQPGVSNRFLLVADSDLRNLFYTTTLLQRFEYSVWTARTGAELLEMTDIAMPALIVIAQRLEDMQGVDVIRQLKRNDRSRNVSIVVLTKKDDPVDERMCLAAGAVTTLSCPVPAESLYRVVQVAIEPMPRMNIRINTSLSVSVNGRTVECCEGECASVLSEHGAYVRIHHPHPLNTTHSVQLHLKGRTISTEAIVIFTQRGDLAANDEPGMGLQFLHMSPEDQEFIRLFIRSEITKGLDRMERRE